MNNIVRLPLLVAMLLIGVGAICAVFVLIGLGMLTVPIVLVVGLAGAPWSFWYQHLNPSTSTSAYLAAFFASAVFNALIVGLVADAIHWIVGDRRSSMKSVTLDFSFAKSPLFVRQTVASAFGIPLGQEFTWAVLASLTCEATRLSAPDQLVIVGISQLEVALPDEAKSLREFLGVLRANLPNLKVLFSLHS